MIDQKSISWVRNKRSSKKKTLRECNCLLEENFVILRLREKLLRPVCLYWVEGIVGPWLWVMDCRFFSSLLCVPAPVLWIQCRQPWGACDEGGSRGVDMGEFEMVDRLHPCDWEEKGWPGWASSSFAYVGTCFKGYPVTNVWVWSDSQREQVVLKR